MTTLSTSPPGDKRQRAGRTAPRRHVDPVESPEVAIYDGVEFPVLLRLPDILREHYALERPEERVHHEVESSVSEPESGRASSRQRHQRTPVSLADEPSGLLTAIASNQFWSGMAPRIAAGGMLLAVTAVCVVLLQGPRAGEDAASDGSSQWANDPPLQSYPASVQTRGNDSAGEADRANDQRWPAKPHAVATMPQSPKAMGSERREVTPETHNQNQNQNQNQIQNQNPVPATNQESVLQGTWRNGWPGNQPSPAAAKPASTSSSQNFQAQGWPSEMASGTEPTSRDSEVQLNSAAMSARGAGPAERTAFAAPPPWNAAPNNTPAVRENSPPANFPSNNRPASNGNVPSNNMLLNNSALPPVNGPAASASSPASYTPAWNQTSPAESRSIWNAPPAGPGSGMGNAPLPANDSPNWNSAAPPSYPGTSRFNSSTEIPKLGANNRL